MAASPEFLAHAHDLFGDLGPLATKPMFGGTALYLEDAMFAVIFNDTLYMKADKALAAEYRAAGSTPFQYNSKTGLRTIAGLTSLPESALDDPEEARNWGRKSLIPAQAAAIERARVKRARPGQIRP